VSEYYVYALLDTRKPGEFSYPDTDFIFSHQPFYIGKGSGPRYKAHLQQNNVKLKHNVLKSRKINKIRSEGFEVMTIKIATFTDEQEAYEYEKHLVNVLGKILDKKGPLTNINDGGGGGNGVPAGPNHYNIGKKASAETKAKMSATHKLLVSTPEHRQNIAEAKKGVPQTPEAKETNRLSHTGHVHSAEHKEAIRQAMTGREVTWGDKISKAQQGAAGPRAKVTEEQAKSILYKYYAEGIPRDIIASGFGLSYIGVYKITVGTSWKYLDYYRQELKEAA